MKSTAQQRPERENRMMAMQSTTDEAITSQASATPDPYNSMMREIHKIADPQSWDQLREFYNIA